jgi:hypothetical protein
MKNTDGFVKVKFFYWDEGVEADRIESMWTTPSGLNYRIENIPFYVQEYALGDLISTKIEDEELYVDKLIEESGNSTIQLVFFDETIIEQTRKELKDLGCSSEVSDKPFYIAINVPSEISYRNIVFPYLDEGKSNELWDFAEACLATKQNIINE